MKSLFTKLIVYLRPMKSKRLTILLRDTRGAAFAEAVVMLPAFLLLWAGINFIYQKQKAMQEALEESRKCAWAYAESSCSEAPTGCIPKDQQEITDTTGASTKLGKARGGLDAVIGSIFGKPFGMITSNSVTPPKLIGGRAHSLKATQFMICNEAARDPGEVTETAACNASKESGDGVQEWCN